MSGVPPFSVLEIIAKNNLVEPVIAFSVLQMKWPDTACLRAILLLVSWNDQARCQCEKKLTPLYCRTICFLVTIFADNFCWFTSTRSAMWHAAQERCLFLARRNIALLLVKCTNWECQRDFAAYLSPTCCMCSCLSNWMPTKKIHMFRLNCQAGSDCSVFLSFHKRLEVFVLFWNAKFMLQNFLLVRVLFYKNREN